MDLTLQINALLTKYANVHHNPSRNFLISESINNKECLPLQAGALATWTPPESTGRSPKDTYIVKNEESQNKIDWNSPNCIAMQPHVFNDILEDSMNILNNTNKLYILDRVVGAEAAHALPVKVITYKALNALFIDTMFRPIPINIKKSIFYNNDFTLLALPYHKLNSAKYKEKLNSNMAVIIDFDLKIGIVFGSSYMGCMKKLLFTVMNFYLPDHGILPLHCSANEGDDKTSALLLGLSGTGKTTLSADPERALLGDDEHSWFDEGVANFEYGCYAKLINLNPAKEPDIYKAIFHADNVLNHGAIIENAMVYPDGTFDLNDSRLTENSRVGFPLSFLTNIKESSVSTHPKTILFLTADAYGVLPPIAKLTPEQAMFWFMMGYTSKLAGTETGVSEPQATFSRFFGEPFMPRLPSHYADLLGKKLQKHNVSVYLINTGWSGGFYGKGKRIDINLTRQMVKAALNGYLNDVSYKQDPIFKIYIPEQCPEIPNNILTPINTWDNKELFIETATKLANKFVIHFNKAFSGKVSREIADECPSINITINNPEISKFRYTNYANL